LFWEESLFSEKAEESDSAGSGGQARRDGQGGQQMGNRSFPKLRKPTTTHADLACAVQPEGLLTTTGGIQPMKGLNTAGCFAGFPKGVPPFGTLTLRSKV